MFILMYIENGKRLLKFIISFLIILQVVGFIFDTSALIIYGKPILFVAIVLRYLWNSRRVQLLHIVVLVIFFMSELSYLHDAITIRYRMIMNILVYLVLFYFLYFHHKSFKYNKRDVFTLSLGSSLYTVIFFITYIVVKEPMGDLYLIGFFHLLLLYMLLIIAGMHYINIRSEKSLWFFLAILNFVFSDFLLLLDTFYLPSKELEILRLICMPAGLVFLVNYMITKYKHLKSEEFEGF